jgi:hypothetical protein
VRRRQARIAAAIPGGLADAHALGAAWRALAEAYRVAADGPRAVASASPRP